MKDSWTETVKQPPTTESVVQALCADILGRMQGSDDSDEQQGLERLYMATIARLPADQAVGLRQLK